MPVTWAVILVATVATLALVFALPRVFEEPRTPAPPPVQLAPEGRR